MTDMNSTNANPIAAVEVNKPFVIGITFNKTETTKETLFLTATSVASLNQADGVPCIIESGQLFCGPEKKTFDYQADHTKTPLEPVVESKMNRAWSKVGDEIKWGAVDFLTDKVAPEVFVTFSRENKKDPNKIFAEVCSSFKHHEKEETKLIFGKEIVNFWQNGVAKAYDVTK